MDELNIEVEDLRTALEAGEDLQLVDVREGWEFALAHLEGAILLPLRELESRVGELDSTRPTVVYCHHGIRSLHATLALRALGFDKARSLRGGIDRWSTSIDSTVPRY